MGEGAALSEDAWIGEDEAWFLQVPRDPQATRSVAFFRALIGGAAVSSVLWALVVYALLRLF